MVIYTSLQKLFFFARVSQGFNIFGQTWRKTLSVRQIKIYIVLGTPREGYSYFNNPSTLIHIFFIYKQLIFFGQAFGCLS